MKPRVTALLIGLILIVIWVGLYPGFGLKMSEAVLLYLALFFFLGVQKFHGDREFLNDLAAQGIQSPVQPSGLSRRWWNWRVLVFSICGLVCGLLFLVFRLIRT